MKKQMKSLTRPILVLGVCLLATLALTAQVQDGKTSDPLANFEAGIVAYQANDLPLAYTAFLAAAEEGHADSQFNVGLMNEKGIGVVKNEKDAVLWYGKAASQGNASAQFNLGVLYTFNPQFSVGWVYRHGGEYDVPWSLVIDPAWVPSVGGDITLVASTLLVGDEDPANDAVSITIHVDDTTAVG